MRPATITLPQSSSRQVHRCIKAVTRRHLHGVLQPPRYLNNGFSVEYQAGNGGRVTHISAASAADTSSATTDGQPTQPLAQNDDPSTRANAGALATIIVADNTSGQGAAEVTKKKRVFRRSFWKGDKKDNNGSDKRKAPFGKSRATDKARTNVQTDSVDAWFTKPEYTVESLYEAIVGRAELGDVDASPLFMLCDLAHSPDEARVVLNAFATVRSALVRKGEMEAYDARLAAKFLIMIRNSDAVDVLVETLQRTTELGLLLSHTQLHNLLKYWSANQGLAKIEEILSVMPLGGLPYNHDTAYIVVRAAKAAGAMDKAVYYAEAMAARQVPLNKATLRLLGRLPPNPNTPVATPPVAATTEVVREPA